MNNNNQIETTKDAPITPRSNFRRHPLTLDNSKEVMFERMATVKDRIAAFEEKLNADRKKNAR